MENPLHPVRHHQHAHHAPAPQDGASADPFAVEVASLAAPVQLQLSPVLLPKPQRPALTPPPAAAAAAAAAAPQTPVDRLGLMAPPPQHPDAPVAKVLPTSAALCAFVRFPACSALLGALAGALIALLTFSLYLAPRNVGPPAGAPAAASPAPAAKRCIPTPYFFDDDLERHWSYISDPLVWDAEVHGPLMGPLQWGTLVNPATGALRFPACANGAQSPVDLLTGGTTPGNGGAPLQLRRRYNSSAFIIGPREERPGFELLPVDGNSVWRLPPGTGSAEDEFPLEEFHFHAPSEHTINGERFALEAHFVHVGEPDHDVVVYTLLFREDVPRQRPNAYLRTFWPDIFFPEAVPTDTSLNVGALLDDVEPVLYSYNGSLTIPPCTPATWYVAVARGRVNQEQLAAFGSRMQQQPSNRPLQPLNARPVTQFKLGSPVSVPP